MERVFVSAPGLMRERWAVAFPDARVVSSVSHAAKLDRAAMGSLWLDLSSIPADLKLKSVSAAASTGWPAVAMVGVPEEAEAFAILKAGAQGYCHVKAAPEQLREIALVVEHGGLWMPPQLMQRFLAVSTRVVAPFVSDVPGLNELSARELMVAEQVARGASNREIATALEISERTVKAHITAILKKLGVRDRVQLALRVNNLPTYNRPL
jgi:two-component system nitrate/nitrite response regulator NarL